MKSLTLIEILFVIILLGILVSVGAPQVKKTFEALELNSFSRDLQAFMNYLSERAIILEEPITLHFEKNGRFAWAEAGDEEEKVKLKTIKIPEGIVVSAEKEAITFSPDAGIDKITVTLTNKNNQKVMLTTKGIADGVKILGEK
ncbi:MAG: type II secretion system GspH family protein [Candidatus Omnitrophica bacterium]|nr:type II secretion system GspH family protein [Candidatus Omnitrophota bacterium]